MVHGEEHVKCACLHSRLFLSLVLCNDSFLFLGPTSAALPSQYFHLLGGHNDQIIIRGQVDQMVMFGSSYSKFEVLIMDQTRGDIDIMGVNHHHPVYSISMYLNARNRALVIIYFD